METRVIGLDSLDDNREVIREAAEIMKNGGLVAVPTETVYGLGADAFLPEAVAKVFEVKKRPNFDPLIVHISSVKELKSVANIPSELKVLVEKLAHQFWPGPLTIVLPKTDNVPDIVTSGLDSVAVRLSAHSVMRALIRELGHPIAAPSANQFGKISPTSASAVQKELDGLIPLILDAGACSEGLESTIVRPIVDEKGEAIIEVLRFGPITREQLKKVAKVKKVQKSQQNSAAPGQLPSHYAPRKPFFLLKSPEDFTPVPGKLALLSLTGDEDSEFVSLYDWQKVVALSPGSGKLSEAAVRLFALMRQLDENPDIDAIYAESVSTMGLGAAIMDRLTRAAYREEKSNS